MRLVMAAFPSRDREAFMVHWIKIMGNESNILKTILFEGHVAGNIVSWEQSGEREVGYWIGKEYWGKGIATNALAEFLSYVKTRPLYAHVARHNVASLRVLQKCGFVISGEEKFAENGQEIVDNCLGLIEGSFHDSGIDTVCACPICPEHIHDLRQRPHLLHLLHLIEPILQGELARHHLFWSASPSSPCHRSLPLFRSGRSCAHSQDGEVRRAGPEAPTASTFPPAPRLSIGIPVTERMEMAVLPRELPSIFVRTRP